MALILTLKLFCARMFLQCLAVIFNSLTFRLMQLGLIRELKLTSIFFLVFRCPSPDGRFPVVPGNQLLMSVIILDIQSNS